MVKLAYVMSERGAPPDGEEPWQLAQLLTTMLWMLQGKPFATTPASPPEDEPPLPPEPDPDAPPLPEPPFPPPPLPPVLEPQLPFG
jgi:hypothetical protein